MKTTRGHGAALGLLLAALLLAGCGGTTPVKEVAETPVPEVPAVDHRAPLQGFWTGAVTGDGEDRIDVALTLTASRFIIAYRVMDPNGHSDHWLESGAWEAAADSIMATWIRGRRAVRLTMSYSLDGNALTVQGLAGILNRSQDRDVPLKRTPDLGAADLAGTWTDQWSWDDGRRRYFALSYDDSDGSCSWLDRFTYAAHEERPDRSLHIAGTCALDLDENFILMDVASEDVSDPDREPFVGYVLRFAFAQNAGTDADREEGIALRLSGFWDEMLYLPVPDTWVDNPYRPYGGYFRWMERQK